MNTSHANYGVLLYAGELILLYSDKGQIEFPGQDNIIFKGIKEGRIYLTTHRIIFNNYRNENLQSFSLPFVALSNVIVGNPLFGPNYLKGKVKARQNGNIVGVIDFKIRLKSGGIQEFGDTLFHAISIIQKANDGVLDTLPPYKPADSWFEAPPSAYEITPGFYSWVPFNNPNFMEIPPNSVFMTDNPALYLGINSSLIEERKSKQLDSCTCEPRKRNVSTVS